MTRLTPNINTHMSLHHGQCVETPHKYFRLVVDGLWGVRRRRRQSYRGSGALSRDFLRNEEPQSQGFVIALL